MTPLRPDLEPLPERMKHLPIDHRGYVVPWFVEWVPNEEGVLVPEFRATSRHKVAYAHKMKLCWVCGNPLGAYKTFVIGPMCGVNRISSEPPSHLECARWSARNCPFMTKPRMVRRVDEDFKEKLEAAHSKENTPGVMLERNPGVMLLWVCKSYFIFRDNKGLALFGIGDPESVEWWAEGRKATRAEIEESVVSGLPLLIDAMPQDLDEAERDRADTEMARNLAALRELYPEEEMGK